MQNKALIPAVRDRKGTLGYPLPQYEQSIEALRSNEELKREMLSSHREAGQRELSLKCSNREDTVSKQGEDDEVDGGPHA